MIKNTPKKLKFAKSPKNIGNPKKLQTKSKTHTQNTKTPWTSPKIKENHKQIRKHLNSDQNRWKSLKICNECQKSKSKSATKNLKIAKKLLPKMPVRPKWWFSQKCCSSQKCWSFPWPPTRPFFFQNRGAQRRLSDSNIPLETIGLFLPKMLVSLQNGSSFQKCSSSQKCWSSPSPPTHLFFSTSKRAAPAAG